MKNELISMVAYVLKYGNIEMNQHKSVKQLHQYANFLNTPLNISMFVPAIKVGDKWEVLEMPFNYYVTIAFEIQNFDNPTSYQAQCKQYQTAKDNVIFEGFNLRHIYLDRWEIEYKKKFIIVFCGDKIISEDFNTIQDLIKYKPTLTKKGLEVSGLNNK